MPTLPPPPLDLDSLNQVAQTWPPQRILSQAIQYFGHSIVMSSSFGAESACLLHLAAQALPNIKILFIDTGYLFPETHAFMESLRQRLDLNIWTYRTRNDPIAYLRDHHEPAPTWRNNIDACCAANKNEPFDRAMRELSPAAWLRGIRRQQADTRASRQYFEFSPRYHCHAISPLLDWTTKDIHAYMKEHDLPYHPLYENGYSSIGCNPLSCTRPIQPGEDPRAGRWSGQSKVECGLHLDAGSGI